MVFQTQLGYYPMTFIADTQKNYFNQGSNLLLHNAQLHLDQMMQKKVNITVEVELCNTQLHFLSNCSL